MNDEASEKNNEISLAAVNEIICLKCGKKGHKASVCPENNKGEKEGSDKQGTKKEKEKCYHCGKVRHGKIEKCKQETGKLEVSECRHK